MKKILGSLAALFLLGGGFVWYAAFDGPAAARADKLFDVEAYRALVKDDAAAAPTEVSMILVGSDKAPRIAVQAGGGSGPNQVAMAYGAFRLSGPSGSVMIDAAMDEATAKGMAVNKAAAKFDVAAYGRMQQALGEATLILLTHEHIDHITGVARAAAPAKIAPHLQLTAPQLAALPKFQPEGGLDPALKALAPAPNDAPRRAAPGVVVAPMPGHSPGSQVIYARLQNGREYLFIGDIVWVMSNIEALKTRPRFLNWGMFDPPEDRMAVAAQVRALADLRAANPDLVIVPAHDGDYLNRLVSEGALKAEF